VAAVAQDSLVDWMQKQNADWRAFAAPGRLLAQPQEETMLQKLIDNAVDEVFAEYDECKSIRSRAVALMDDGEPRTIELTFSGGLTELATMLADANSAIGATGARSGTSIISLFDQGNEMVFISAGCGGRKAICVLMLDRKTGISVNDIVLVTGLEQNDDPEIYFCMPTEWVGPTCTVELITTSAPFSKILM
jgi:hypothetical protein